MQIALVIFIISVFFIFNTMFGYPFFLILVDKFKKPNKIKTNYNYKPTITYMIVAHNEEKVILKKLENALTLDYPAEIFNILVASDNSTDKTNELVEKYIIDNPNRSISLYCTKEHKGKTNAQNEAQKAINSEIIVMTDANSILNKNAIKELISYFSSDDIVYVCGRLAYSNSKESITSDLESAYWNIDLKMRDIESRIQTITAGNGAIYACRKSEYVDFDPIECHDSSMPLYYGVHNKRAVFNPNAIAIEKAGEINLDEFMRKVRMNRIIFKTLKNSFQTLNIFKLKWFSIFFFFHRTCRYLLWLAHLLVLISSTVIAFTGNIFAIIITVIQLMAIILAIYQLKRDFGNRYIRMFGYYAMTVLAQVVGVYKIIMKKSKPTWEKVKSTR